MSLLTDLHEQVVVGAKEPPSTEDEINLLKKFSSENELCLPEDYLELIREATEVEFVIRGVGCLRIWSAVDVLELNVEYDVQKYLPDALAIGDDEGGNAFAIMNGNNGLGVYRFSFSDPDRDEAVFIASSLKDLLKNGDGIDRVFDWE